MKNYLQPGEMLEFIAAAAHSSGDVVQVGDLIGVATGDAAIGDEAVMQVEGVFELTPAGAAVAGLTNGAKAYWDGSEVSDTPGTFMGYVFGSDAVTGSVKVKLAPVS